MPTAGAVANRIQLAPGYIADAHTRRAGLCCRLATVDDRHGVPLRAGITFWLPVFRIEESQGRIARLRSYGFCPGTIRAAGGMPGASPVSTARRASGTARRFSKNPGRACKPRNGRFRMLLLKWKQSYCNRSAQ